MNRSLRKSIVYLVIFMCVAILGTKASIAVEEKAYIDLSFNLGKTEYFSNGKKVTIDIAPMIQNSRTLAPFRSIFEELEYQIEWIQDESKIVATNGDKNIELVIGNNIAKVNGKEYMLDVSPQIVNGRTEVPLRFVSEVSDAMVEWEQPTQTVRILKLKPITTMQVSPNDKQGIFYRETTKKYYLCDSDGKNPKLLGEYSVIKWVTDDKLYGEQKDGKTIKSVLVGIDGRILKDADKKMAFVGKTKNEDILVTEGTGLFYVKGDQFVKITDLPKDSVYVYAQTVEGPFIAFTSKKEIQIAKIGEKPVKVGVSNMMANVDGDVITNNRFQNSVFFSENSKKIAFYQKISNNLWLYIFDTKDLENSIKTILDFNKLPEEKISSLNTRWLSQDSLVIDSDKFGWNISLKNGFDVDFVYKQNQKYTFANSVIYLKGTDTKKLYFANDKKAKIVDLFNKEVVSWYPYKGSILISLFDKDTKMSNFVLYQKNKLTTLLDDFKIENTLEYNDNLLINGLDITKKYNILYRFDGSKIYTVQENFYTGKYSIYKDILVINKYNNLRNYSLIAFDKNSWNPTLLHDKFVINNFLVGTKLFILGVEETGIKKPFASFDGIAALASSYKILHSNVENAKIENFAESGGRVYTNYKQALMEISGGSSKEVFLQKSGTSYVVKASDGIVFMASNIESSHDKLYVGVLNLATKVVAKDGKVSYKKLTEPIVPSFVAEFDGTASFSSIIADYKLSEFKKDDDYLYILGEYLETKDKLMFILDNKKPLSNTNPYRVMDVTKLVEIIKNGSKTFLDVEDLFRITSKVRNVVLEYSDSQVKDLITDAKRTYWDIINDTLVLGCFEADAKKNKIYTYQSKFQNIFETFDTNLWKKLDKVLFVGGLNKDTEKDALYLFEGPSEQLVIENFAAKNVIDVMNGNYLLFGTDLEKDSKTYKQEVLYVYNKKSKEVNLAMQNTTVLDMIDYK